MPRPKHCQNPFFRNSAMEMGVPSATVVLHGKIRLFSISWEGLLFRVPLAEPDGTLGVPFGALPLRRQSLTEGPPPLDAFFAFGSKAPNPLSGEIALKLNDVFIGIGGHRFSSIAGLGPTGPSLQARF